MKTKETQPQPFAEARGSATNMRNPNGPSIEDQEFARDCEMDDYIAEQHAKESKAVREAKCTVCKTVWVDVMSGEDTCDECKVA